MSIEREKVRKCEFEKRHFTSKERAGADIYLTIGREWGKMTAKKSCNTEALPL